MDLERFSNTARCHGTGALPPCVLLSWSASTSGLIVTDWANSSPGNQTSAIQPAQRGQSAGW